MFEFCKLSWCKSMLQTVLLHCMTWPKVNRWFLWFLEKTLVKGKIQRRIPVVTPYYWLSLKIKPIQKIPAWGSIVHLTTGGDVAKLGYRTPAVFFHANTFKLHICSSINGNRNYCWNSPFQLPHNKYSRIAIGQQVVNGHLLYRILYNGKQVFSVRVNKPYTFKKVIAYGADPWYAPAKAVIKDLKFRNIRPGTITLPFENIL